MTPGDVIQAIRYQGVANFIVPPRNGWGIFSRRSHVRADGTPKRCQWEDEAVRTAELMSCADRGEYEAYKCLFCEGFHVGRNR